MLSGTWIASWGIVWVGIWVVISPGYPAQRTLTFEVQFLGDALIEIALGAAVLALGWWILDHPSRHRIVGALMIGFGALSLEFPPVGGFFIGFILALVAGILIIIWRPTRIIIPDLSASIQPPTP